MIDVLIDILCNNCHFYLTFDWKPHKTWFDVKKIVTYLTFDKNLS